MIHCQLWMGCLESYMTEAFIIAAFKKMGEHPINAKVMRNKITGEPNGYCFVQFRTDEEAVDAMHKLNGKPIPGTSPVVRFRLNSASNASRNILGDYSIWVGDLSPDVDDYNLYRVFLSKYNTIKTARVIQDNYGRSKGYGFVSFGSEDEMKDSLKTMNGFIGLGTKALKISNAVPKPRGFITESGSTSTTTTTSVSSYSGTPGATTDYTQFYDPSTYWQNYWQTQQTNYYEQPDRSKEQQTAPAATQIQQPHCDDDLELIDHTVPLDVDKLNEERIGQDCNLWDALESSKWFLCDSLEVC